MPRAASRPVAAPWGSRIVRTGTSPAGQFLGNERNWRVHPAFQQDQMQVVLEKVGFVQSVIVNLRSSDEWPAGERGVETMVDGHLRVQLALSRGEDTLVPVTYVDLTPAEERAVLATFDALGGLAVADKEKLPPLIEEVSLDFADTDLDLEALFKLDKAPTKGLKHTVHECTCCQKKCRKGCGCYEGDVKPRRKKR
jgi:hypothetical protein